MNIHFYLGEINSEKGRLPKPARDYGPCPSFTVAVSKSAIILHSCSFSDYPVISQISV
jgi:hypothetical protein